MALLGSVPSVQFLVLAGDGAGGNPPAIPASSSNPREITANLANDVSSLEIFNTSGGTLELLEGQNGNLKRLCYIPGSSDTDILMQRQPVALSRGARLSIRSSTDSAIQAGSVVINAWV